MDTWLIIGLGVTAFLGMLAFFSLAIKKRKRDNTEVFLLDVLEGSASFSEMTAPDDSAPMTPKEAQAESVKDKEDEREDENKHLDWYKE